MKPSTMKAFNKMMKECNRPPQDGDDLSVHAEKTFTEFEAGLRKFMEEGDIDPQLLAMVGAGFELTIGGARTTAIKKGMYNVMLAIADYCFKDEERDFVLAKVEEKKKEWREKIAELDERTAKLETLSPDDILNAPVVAGLPNN